MTDNRLTAAESSKLLKRELRRAFPGVQFSVRMSRGTGYGNVHVTWSEGPSQSEVEPITDSFEGKSFDGMTDSTSYRERPVLIDEQGNIRTSGLGYVLLQGPRVRNN